MLESCDPYLVMGQIGTLLGKFHKVATASVSEQTAPLIRLTDGKERILEILFLFKPSLYRDAKRDYKKPEKVYEGGEKTVCVHGDFHLGNIMEENSDVCGLLDFAECKRDSPLYDIAYLFVESYCCILPSKRLY